MGVPLWQGRELNSGLLHDLMVFCGVGDEIDLLAAARLKSHKLAPTLLGTYEQEGKLTDEQAAELDTHRSRHNECRRFWDELKAVIPGITVMKGFAVAEHYPPGFLRASADLDFLCTPKQLWQAGLRLQSCGWELARFALLPNQKSFEIIAVYERSGQFPNEIELKTVEYVRGIPGIKYPFPPAPATVRNLLALLAERVEQPFRSRDLLDVALLLHTMGLAEINALAIGLNAALLWPEWREMRGLLLRLGWLPAHAAVLKESIEARRKRIMSVTRSMFEKLDPVHIIVRLLQQTFDADSPSWRHRLSTFFHLHGGVARAAQTRALMSIPLDCTERSDQLSLKRRGPHLVAITPLGSFLMLVGSYQDEWLTQAHSTTNEQDFILAG